MISLFDATIEEMVALAVLMPIVASLGGNAGTQTMTVTVRALATRDLDIYNAGRVIRREVVVGLLNGAVIATLIGVVAGDLVPECRSRLVIAAAMVINMLAAALAGILIPLLLDQSRRRPGDLVVDLHDDDHRCHRLPGVPRPRHLVVRRRLNMRQFAFQRHRDCAPN